MKVNAEGDAEWKHRVFVEIYELNVCVVSLTDCGEQEKKERRSVERAGVWFIITYCLRKRMKIKDGMWKELVCSNILVKRSSTCTDYWRRDSKWKYIPLV